MITCGVVLLLTCAASFTYEYFNYRNNSKRTLSTLGKIVAANSTAALAFDDKENAEEILGALVAKKNLVAACLYDINGKIFAVYPKNLSASGYPATIQQQGYVFNGDYIEGFEPVVEKEKQLGTLFLRTDMKEGQGRFILYGIMGAIFILISFSLAYWLSGRLQKSIVSPILELAQTAKLISEQRNYSVRASKKTDDEL